jgi:molybdopterin/thiamine biosynthesis adenylyltransferase
LIEVIAIHERYIDNASFNDYDIIVDGSDNFVRYLVNDTLRESNIDLWKYSGFEGQVAVLIIERVKPARLIS